jgi:hypothetical protein
MTDPKLPQLAEGSRWDERLGEPCVIDDDDQEIAISQVVTMPGGRFISVSERASSRDSVTVGAVYVTDALAVIRRAGLDAEYDALREKSQLLLGLLREHNRNNDRFGHFIREAMTELEALL